MHSDKAASDHNTISISLNFHNVDRYQLAPVSKWNINPSEKARDAFVHELANFEQKSKEMIFNTDMSTDERYGKWFSELSKIISRTIGKKTVKTSRPEKFSESVKILKEEKRAVKKEISEESDNQAKKLLKARYIDKQKQTRELIKKEREIRIKDKFEKMMSDKSRKTYWNEIKEGNKKPPSSWITIKDADGRRLTDPRDSKEWAASYYEGLFKKQDILYHPYHDIVTSSINAYEQDFSHDDEEYNECPTFAEIKNAIQKKKNGKSTTDIPNEILKYGEDEMAKVIYHVFRMFWLDEVVPSLWNEGLISSLWKGKGDKEKLEFHRGITVSSSISMIPEEIIHNRMRSVIELTQAQGGGKKGSATRDHVFLLRSVISTCLKQKRKIFVTFFDVQKAYDHADPDDMLYIAWNSGLKGKIWRLTKLLNTDLTARIHTRYGKTRKIEREIGGKQGGKIMTFLFAKLMDTLAEDLQNEPELGIHINNILLAVLEWVNDVVSFAENHEQQLKTLEFINDFAVKHKLSWGPDKCKVMHIGAQNDPSTKWKLGDKEITSTNQYTYLGDIISADGGNAKNLENRRIKLQAVTRKVLASSQIEVLQGMGTKTILQLHETYTISAVLTNCETWILTKTDRNKLDKMEIWAYKKLLGLPITTPTAAIIFETRSMFMSIRVINRQLKYLHILLSRDNADWYKTSLLYQIENNAGWGAYILKILDECEISLTIEEITHKKKGEWWHIVECATRRLNSKMILDSCRGKAKMRTKTLKISQTLERDLDLYDYKDNELFTLSKKTVKLIIMARCGMLDCAKNFKGKYGSELCKECNEVDDESHRINVCGRWEHVNMCKGGYSIDFGAVYSEEMDTIRQISQLLRSVWNIENGKNEIQIKNTV